MLTRCAKNIAALFMTAALLEYTIYGKGITVLQLLLILYELQPAPLRYNLSMPLLLSLYFLPSPQSSFLLSTFSFWIVSGI